MRQLGLFDTERLPRKPYCSDNLEFGTKIRKAETAMRCPYIQPNAPELHFRLVFDIDRAGAALSFEDANLATPNWIATNSENGHAHIGYEVGIPIGKGPNHRQAPMRLLAAIEGAYLDGLKADRSYAGLLCKNPHHPQWVVSSPVIQAYDLPTLADYVDLNRFNDRRKTTEFEQYGLGRNCLIFESLRRWAYKNVDEYRLAGGSDASSAWLAATYDQALKYNADFPTPLDPREVSHVAKSVGRWCWRFYWGKQESDRRFSALQAKRGSGSKLRDAMLGNVLKLHRKGISQSEIARQLGVSRQNISNWLKVVKKP